MSVTTTNHPLAETARRICESRGGKWSGSKGMACCPAHKGRQIAAVIMDRWLAGERRHVWITKNEALLEDARRDWEALGGLPLDLQPLSRWKLGYPVTMSEGILFVTYPTLRSGRAEDSSAPSYCATCCTSTLPVRRGRDNSARAAKPGRTASLAMASISRMALSDGLGPDADEARDTEYTGKRGKAVALCQMALGLFVREFGLHGWSPPQPASRRQWESGVALSPRKDPGRYQ